MYTFAQPLNRALSTAAASPAVVFQDNPPDICRARLAMPSLANGLRMRGLVPGDRIGVIGLNSDRYLELYLPDRYRNPAA